MAVVMFCTIGLSSTVTATDETLKPKGMLSLTRVEPGITPYSDYSGDFLNRATITGDWGGFRTDLYEKGITLDAVLTQVYQNVVSGGPDSSGNDSTYTGLVDYGMSFDTGKLGMWPGGLFTVNAQTGFANNFPLESGNLSPTNFTGYYPTADKPDTVVMEYYWTQALSKDLGFVLGRINATNFLDRNRYADNPRNQFMNISMNNSPLLGSMVSFSTYALLVSWKVNDNLAINPAIYDPNVQPDEGSPDGGLFNDIGLGLEVDLTWTLSGDRDGAVRIDALWNNKETVLLDNPRLPIDLILGVPPKTKSDNWLININFGQSIWKPASAKPKKGPHQQLPQVRSAAFDMDETGLGVFGRVAFGPEDRHAYNVYAMGGVGGRGLVSGRPYDRVGVGFYWLKESDDLDDQPGDLLDDETGIEVFYNLALTPAVQLTFDVQWIDSGIKASNNATVLGMRLMTIF
jgi:carbohydrate-selective porin OprB